MHYDFTLHIADVLVMATIAFTTIRSVELRLVQLRLDLDLLRQRVDWLEDRKARREK